MERTRPYLKKSFQKIARIQANLLNFTFNLFACSLIFLAPEYQARVGAAILGGVFGTGLRDSVELDRAGKV